MRTEMTWDVLPGLPPQVVVAGGIGADGEADLGEMLVVHRSQALADTLRRFKVEMRLNPLANPPASATARPSHWPSPAGGCSSSANTRSRNAAS